MTEAGWVRIGRVQSVNPVRREVRIGVDEAYARVFDGLPVLRLAVPGATPLRVRPAAVKSLGGVVVAMLPPGVPREVVAGLRHAAVLVSEQEAGPAAALHLGADDLAGMRVTLAGGAEGAVAGVTATAAGLLMHLALDNGAGLAVMFCEATVAAVDTASRRLVLCVPAPSGDE